MEFINGKAEISFDPGATDGLTRIWVRPPHQRHLELIKATEEELVELRTELTRAITRQRNKRKKG